MGETGQGMDFLDCLGPDTSATVFTLLDDPADLARASAVSRSWRRFVIENQFSKIQCLRAYPEVATFTDIEENVLQSFKLPHPVLCIGGVVKIELLGGVVKDAYDGRYYICVSHVQVAGKPLSRELRVAPRGNGVVLSYYADPHGCGMPHSESSGDDGHSKCTALRRGPGTLLWLEEQDN